MPINVLSFVSVVLAFTSVLLIIFSDWRMRISLLALQYTGAFLLIQSNWPIASSISILISGWITGAVIGMALLTRSSIPSFARQKNSNIPNNSSLIFRILRYKPQNIFYVFAALIIIIFSITISPAVSGFFPGQAFQFVWPGITLIAMGLLQLGFHVDALSTTIGLLTFLTGFTIIFSGIEKSTLITGLLAIINMSLGLVGAYLLLAPSMAEE